MARHREYVIREIEYETILHDFPFPRSGHRMVSHGKDVYVWGGMNTEMDTENEPIYADDPVWAQTIPCFREMWKFSYDSHSWELLENEGQVPECMIGHGMCISGDIIYVYGGTKIPYGEVNSNELYVFDIRTQVWRRDDYYQMAHFPDYGHQYPFGQNLNKIQTYRQHTVPIKPNPFYGQAVIAKLSTSIELRTHYEDEIAPATTIYVFGGATGSIPPDFDNSLFEYNTRTTYWEVLENARVNIDETWPEIYKNAQYPTTSFRAELALHGDYVYVIGGGDHISVDGLEVIRAYNLRTRKWNVLTTIADYDDSDPNNVINYGYPRGRKAFGCAQYKDEVFIIGGTDSRQLLDDIWKLDLVTLRWTFVCRMPTPIKYHSASVSLDGILSIFGGALDPYSTVRSRVLLCMNLRTQRLDDLALEVALPELQGIYVVPKVVKWADEEDSDEDSDDDEYEFSLPHRFMQRLNLD